jgi:tRNA(fMet)-specific endonuclease VapC
MAQLIDISVFIGLERRGQQSFALATGAISSDQVALAAITASALLAGVHRANTPERRVRREAFVEAVLTMVPVLPFDLQVARTHAQLWAQLSAAGQPLGAHDLLVAATALSHGFSLLTDNLGDFNRIPGLTVARPDW